MAAKLLKPQRINYQNLTTESTEKYSADAGRIAAAFCLYQRIALCTLWLSFFVADTFAAAPDAYAQPLPIPAGERCAECGMTIDRDSKFASEVIDVKGRRLFFCDIGDMLYHFRKSKSAIRSVYVRDFNTGAWIDGRKARYVPNEKFVTPMSWGIAAFSSIEEAMKWGAPADFDAAFALAK
jgi:copper chaperone NosL